MKRALIIITLLCASTAFGEKGGDFGSSTIRRPSKTTEKKLKEHDKQIAKLEKDNKDLKKEVKQIKIKK